jgi:hypothetical protein
VKARRGARVRKLQLMGDTAAATATANPSKFNLKQCRETDA